MTPMRTRGVNLLTGLSIGLCTVLHPGSGPELMAKAAQARPKTETLPPAPPVPLERIKPEATLTLPSISALVVTPDSVWVADRAKQTITKIDPTSNAAGTPMTLDGPPCGTPLVAFRTLWVTLCERQQIQRVEIAPTPTPSPAATPKPTPAATPSPAAIPDAAATKGAPPAKPVAVKTPGGGIGVLATGASSVWAILSTTGTIARIDPDTSTVVAEVSVLNGANALAFANDSLWAVSTSKGVVTRINGNSNVVMKVIPVGKSPVAITSGAGSLWVLNAGDATVSRIDPAADKVAETIKLGVPSISGQSGSIVFAEGSIWLSVPGTPLARVDPASNRVVQRFTGASGGTLVAGLKSLWLVTSPTTLWRIDPKRAEATR